MARKFCSDCLTFHDGTCSPGALARVGKGKTTKRKSVEGAGVAGSNPASAGIAETQAGLADKACTPESYSQEDRGNTGTVAQQVEHRHPPEPTEITKEQIVDALTVSLPKAEADKLREFAAKMEANAKANRERVAAHKAGLSVAEYRANQKKVTI